MTANARGRFRPAGARPSARRRLRRWRWKLMTQAAPAGAARYAGARVERVEDARLLAGQGTYVDYTRAEHAEALVHESHGSNLVGEIAGMPAAALEDVFASAAHVVSETIYQQAYAAVPMEGRGLVVDYGRVTGDLTIYSATQSP